MSLVLGVVLLENLESSLLLIKRLVAYM